MKPTGHSPLFRLLHRAILERKQVAFGYQGYPREVCPIILGHKESRERLLAYQFAGTGSRGPVIGEWKCFDLDQIKDAKTRAGRWYSGGTHRAPQSCIACVAAVSSGASLSGRARSHHVSNTDQTRVSIAADDAWVPH
jgi:hypothetical protein